MQHVSMPIVNLIMTGANIRAIRKQHGLSVKDLRTSSALQPRRPPTSSRMCPFLLSQCFDVPMEKILVIEVER